MVIKPDESNKRIVLEPVNEIIEKIKESNNNRIFLAGDINTGKSIVLKEYLYQSNDLNNPVIDVSLKYGEYNSHLPKEIFDLYHMCLIIQKMLEFIKKNHPYQYSSFDCLEGIINNVMLQIKYMLYSMKFDNKDEKISNFLLNDPSVLLDHFWNLAVQVLDFKTITVVIDNFDEVGLSSCQYQKYLYNALSERLNIIATISDKEVLYNEDRRKALEINNEVISVDYSKDVSVVREILAHLIPSETIENGQTKTLIDDEVIEYMIKNTNGNISDMMYAISQANRNLTGFNKDSYVTAIIDYVDKEINKHPMLKGNPDPVRKLHI